MKTKKVILVMGMHRSGTSAFTGCMNAIGLNLGKTLMPGTKYNSKGHFENMAVFELNEWLLRVLESKWDETSPTVNNNLSLKDQAYFENRVDEIIKSEFENDELLVVKDPRFSLIGENWVSYLDKIGYKCYSVLMKRHPGAVLHSLQKRDGFSYEKSGAIYMNYLLSALKLMPQFEKSKIVDFFELRENCSKVFGDLFREFELPEREYSEACKFIDSKLVHTKVEEFTADHVPVLIHDFYKDLSVKKTEDVFKIHLARFKKIHKNTSFLDQSFKELQNELLNSKVELGNLLALKSEFSNKLEESVKLVAEKKYEISELKMSLSAQLERAEIAERRLCQSETNIEVLKNDIIQLEHDKIKIIDTYDKKLKQINVDRKNREEHLLNILENTNLLNEEELFEIESDYETLELKLLEFTMDYKTLEEQEVQNLQMFMKERESHNLDKKRLLELISHSKDQYSLAEKELMEHRQSISSRLGFALTFLPRKLLFFFTVFFKWGKVIIKLVPMIFASPKSMFRLFTLNNVSAFFSAVRTENTETLFFNIKSRVLRTQRLITPEQESGLIYNIDLCQKIDEQIFVAGWVLHPSGVTSVGLFIEGADHDMNYGMQRLDVSNVHSGYVNGSNCGFSFSGPIGDTNIDSYKLKVHVGNRTIFIPLVEIGNVPFEGLGLNDQYRFLLEGGHFSFDESIIDFEYNPLISVVMPVYNVEPVWLNEAIESILRQSYTNWELCIHDDCSPNKSTLEALEKWAHKGDNRIKISFGETNLGIGKASNRALSLTQGEYISLLDHDDVYTDDALYNIVKAINENRNLDFIYSDEDKLDFSGNRCEPHFKPDWSPETFESMMYTCHLATFSASIMKKVGGWSSEHDGSQDYDLVLRVVSITDNIHHIPKILYHWRMIEGSASASTNAKSYAYVAAKKALEDHVERLNHAAKVSDSKWLGSYRIKREIINDPSLGIIIPFKNELDLTYSCVKSVIEKSTYNNKIILLVNNRSDASKRYDLFKRKVNNLGGDVRILDYDRPFNYSALNNFAVKTLSTDHVLFLNNDTKVISPDWIQEMLMYSQLKDIGAVGAKLYYGDDTIQHAGVILGIVGPANHAFRHLDRRSNGYFGYANVVRNYSAVTGACMMVKRELFVSVGGFDEDSFAIAYNDIDFCLRLMNKGKRNVYTPFAELYHYEGKSRGVDTAENERLLIEQENFVSKYSKYIDRDPNYNINLTKVSENFSLNLPS